MPIAKVNNINMYYEVYGNGETLIIIRGIGAEITSFGAPEVATKFAHNYKVISFDNRGVGRTDKPGEPYSIEMMAEDTVGLMDVLGIQRAHVLGSSMGSCIAQTIAAKYPERVNGLILHVATARLPLSMKIMGGIMRKIPGSRKKMVREMDVIFKQKYPPTLDSLLRQGDAMSKYDGRRSLRLIKAPTLIVCATKDQFFGMKCSNELYKGISNSRIVEVDGGHEFAWTQPDMLVKPALEFLTGIDGGSTAEITKKV